MLKNKINKDLDRNIQYLFNGGQNSWEIHNMYFKLC